MRKLSTQLLAIGVVSVWTHAAYAAGTNMPWEAPLQQILDSIQGPVARVIGLLA